MAHWGAVQRLRRLPRDVLLAATAAIALGVALVAVVAVRVATAPADRIPPGVTIGDVHVGGLTEDEAVRAVRALARPDARAVELAMPGEEGFPMRVPVSGLKPEPRAVRAVREAMDSGSPGRRILRELGLASPRRVSLAYRPDPARLREVVGAVAAAVDIPPRDAAVRVRGGRIRVVPSAEGRRVRADLLVRRLELLPARVTVPTATVPPAVADEAARTARDRAARIADGPVVVRGGGREAVVPREVLLRALRFPAEEGRLLVRLHPEAIRRAIAPGFADLVRAPRAAGFAVRGDRVSVIPAVVGRRIDAAAVAGLIARRPAADAVPVRMEPIPPQRTTEQARAMRIRELVSEFTTNYACCPPRVTNIRRAAAILDGAIIPAGATFSLNEALGERTTERGFVPAPQINAGRLEDAVGGGVSQIATTFFNAAFFAGLRIVTHTPHEFYISRYPLGREATISWGGPELIVENDWPAAVLVKAEATDTGVTFRLYSDGLGRRVETETRGSPSGGTFTVSYTRKVWRGDELRRDEEWSWTYRPAPPE